MKNRRDFFKTLLFGALAVPLVKANQAFAAACPSPAAKSAKIQKKMILLDHKVVDLFIKILLMDKQYLIIQAQDYYKIGCLKMHLIKMYE